ncbi:MAG: DUF2341 domain-containing protein, partial [Fibrobacteria bacterium]|nr:DUF2341 domain-containing protein [Fibrobacteria bacterium]
WNGGNAAAGQSSVAGYTGVRAGGAGGSASSTASSARGVRGNGITDNSYPGSNGGTGGIGSGGGILLKCANIDAIDLTGATLDARGGNNLTGDYAGTVKIFYSGSYTSGTLYYGRLFEAFLDTTAPSTAGTPADAGATASHETVTFNWTASSDVESGISGYILQVGTTPGDSNVYNVNVGNVLTKDVLCPLGATYYARVKAVNGAYLEGNFSGNSDGISVNYGSWSYSMDFTLNTTVSGANVIGDVYNFPVLVRLNSSNFNFAEAKDSGQDVRFSKSDSSLLYYEIERWDNSGQKAEIWVLVDTVYGNNNTQFVKMYWGNTVALNQSEGTGVFQTSNAFQGVWHLNEEGNTTVDGYKDATANADHGTGINMIAGYHGQAVSGDGAIFNGSSNYIDLGTPPTSLGWEYSLTFSGWVWTYQRNGWTGIFGKGTNNDNTAPLVYNYDGGTGVYYAHDSYNVLEDGLGGNKLPVDQRWTHVAFTWDGMTAKTYVNGALANTDSGDATPEAFWWEQPGYIGYYPGFNKFDGWLDEIRLSNTERSANWLKLSHKNQSFENSLFYGDTYVPVLLSITPDNNADSVDFNQILYLRFSEEVDAETDSIWIKRTSDNSVFEAIEVTDAKVTGTGTPYFTINPSGTFEYKT